MNNEERENVDTGDDKADGGDVSKAVCGGVCPNKALGELYQGYPRGILGFFRQIEKDRRQQKQVLSLTERRHMRLVATTAPLSRL